MNWFLRKRGLNHLGDTIANLESYWGSPDTTVLETDNLQGNLIDVSELPAGVYMVQVATTEGKQRFGKLVKK